MSAEVAVGRAPGATVETGPGGGRRAVPWFVVGLAALAVWVVPARRRGVAPVAGMGTAAGLLLVRAFAFGRADGGGGRSDGVTRGLSPPRSGGRLPVAVTSGRRDWHHDCRDP